MAADTKPAVHTPAPRPNSEFPFVAPIFKRGDNGAVAPVVDTTSKKPTIGATVANLVASKPAP